MRNKCKKILSLAAAVTLLGSTFAFASCGDYYKQSATVEYKSSDVKATSNGGFAVEKDGFVYFVNGAEDYTADNTFGDVVKGSLMRISTEDLKAGAYDKAETVVPMLFVAQDYTSGIYIYGDYVYYATPTTDKDRNGEVANSYLDFKCAKLDGTEVMKKKKFFRLSSNSTTYRYVEENGVVYCMYVENGALKSYNTKTDKTTVLVKGASQYYFDQKDLTNPNVYYAMSVTYDIDTEYASAASYNQIYTVNAASTAKVNKEEASYTVVVNGADYRTYDFDKDYLEKINADEKASAKENHTDYKATYVLDDYTTYPYVNLGTLVLDGVGSECTYTQYNNEYSVDDCNELQGYTYSIARYENGGVYYTRTEVTENTNLYYLPDATMARDAVKANGEADIVAKNTNNTGSALFEVTTNEDGTRTHTYLYVSGDSIYRAEKDVEEDLAIATGLSGATLWKTEGDYVYYYASGSNPVTGDSTSGNNLCRVNYTGDADKYHTILNLGEDQEYKPLTMTYVDFASSWYMPEMFGDVLLYANAQAVGSNSYNYIYATSLKTDDIVKNNEVYEAVYKHIENDFGDDEELNAALKYYYRLGTQDAADYVKELHEEEYYTAEEYESFEKFVKEIADGSYVKESDLVKLVGEINEADEETMAEAWEEFLPHEHETESEETGLKPWQIIVIVAASVVVLAGAVVTIVVVVNKKKAKKAEAEATVNAYKRKVIDTTEDDDIDVYADEEASESENE